MTNKTDSRSPAFGPGVDRRSRIASAPRSRARAPQHFHLPSVHVVVSGFDYSEDLYITGSGPRQRIEREVTVVLYEAGEAIVRQTRDVLCAEDWAQLQTELPVLMEEGNISAEAAMQDVAREEYARQIRISAGEEKACAGCGCSATRACSGGCIWLNETRCSRCGP